MNVVESYMRELHKLAGTCTDCENLCCDFGMSVEVEQCSSEEQLESEETRTTAEILNDLRLTYTKAFMLSLSNLHICKALPEDFDPSALQESRLTYTKEFMLSLSNLQICKDLPKDFDPSVLRYSRLTYTKTSMLSLSNLQICEDLPKDFDPSILRELDGLSECKLGMQQTSTILPPYTSNNYYTGSSPVLRCDLVADSRLCCGRWGKQVSQGCCDSDSRTQNDCSGILGSFLSKSKNPYRPPQYYKVGGSNSYASHSSKGTKSLTNTACTVEEDVQSKNDTFQDDVLGNKSTHWRKHIANLSEAQKSVNKFVDEEKSHCKTHGSINGAITTQQEQLLDSEPKASIATINLEEFETRQFGESLEVSSINGAITTQQEQLLDSEPKASIAIINLEEFETRQFGESLEKEVSLQHTDFPGIETRCLKGPCTGRMENGIHTANILAAESHENLKLNWESKEDFETEISNELLLGEAFFPSQKNLYERISKTKELQPNEFFLASVLSDCGAFGTDGEGIADSIFDCELELDEIVESECPFDDFWTEILDVIHLEQESRDSYSADTVNITESEVPLHIQDEDELDLLNYQEEPKDPKIANVDTSIDLDFVEDEINLPDEDSLISVDHLLSLSDHCSEVTFVGRTDRLKPDVTSDSTGHPEVAHCYEKSFLPGWKVSSAATHRKPYPHQISSKTPCIHVNPEIPTFHPLDLYFTCSHFKNIREEKLGHYYPPAIYFYPWSNIHHESSMKTAPAMEKKYEHLERYPMLNQPDNSLQQMELLRESQTDPIEQVVYDVVQQWDDMQKLPETYHQQLHYLRFGFPI